MVTRNIRPFSDFSEKGLFYCIENFDEIKSPLSRILSCFIAKGGEEYQEVIYI